MPISHFYHILKDFHKNCYLHIPPEIIFLDLNESDSDTILTDFRNAPIYIFCLFHMADLRMFSLPFLSSSAMRHDLPYFRFAHVVHYDVTPALVLFSNCHLT